MFKNLKSFVKKIRDFLCFLFIFLNGWKQGDSKGITSPESYMALRKLFVLTNGRFNDFISFWVSLWHPKYKNIRPKGILGDLTHSELKNVITILKTDGYYVCPQKLDSQIINRLVDFAKKTPVPASGLISINEQMPFPKEILFDPENPISPRYMFTDQQLFDNQDVKNLIADESLLAVVQEYFNCSPVFDSAVMWWSAPFKGQKTSEAAQEYHFDLESIKFLKIFIYLTDVNPDTGPHCYIRGSHLRKPKSLLKDERISTEEMHSQYQLSDCKEICGKAGSIIIGDTKCFHKGKPLLKGYRLILEYQFSNTAFCSGYSKVQHAKSDSQILNEYIQKYPRTYGLISAGIS